MDNYEKYFVNTKFEREIEAQLKAEQEREEKIKVMKAI